MLQGQNLRRYNIVLHLILAHDKTGQERSIGFVACRFWTSGWYKLHQIFCADRPELSKLPSMLTYHLDWSTLQQCSQCETAEAAHRALIQSKSDTTFNRLQDNEFLLCQHIRSREWTLSESHGLPPHWARPRPYPRAECEQRGPSFLQENHLWESTSRQLIIMTLPSFVLYLQLEPGARALLLWWIIIHSSRATRRFSREFSHKTRWSGTGIWSTNHTEELIKFERKTWLCTSKQSRHLWADPPSMQNMKCTSKRCEISQCFSLKYIKLGGIKISSV